MNLQEAINRPRILKTGMLLSQYTPQSVGIRLAWWASGILSRFRPAPYHIVRANLRQVLGPDAAPATLDRMTRRVFYSFIRSHFDLFHTLRLPQEQVMASVDLSASAQPIVHALRDDPRPFVLVALHLGNFDLAGQTLSAYRPQVQALSLPNPTPGFQFANELRQRSGVQVTPLSQAAIRQAVTRLRLGGTVAIGADRPVSDLDEPVSFFGRPARMPSGHVRLALKSDAVVAVCCCPLLPETQRYTVHVEPLLEMVRTGNRDEEVRINMRRVLDQVEGLIQRWPDQWQMFVPVWPELVDQAAA